MSDTPTPPAPGGEATPPAPPAATPPPPPPAPAGDGVPQERVNALVAETKNTAAAHALRDKAKAMGFESVEAMDAYLADAKARELADMTEVDRLKAEAQQAADAAAASQAAADEATRNAQEISARAQLQLALVGAGINPERIETAMTLGMSAILQATAEAPVTEADAVAQVQAATPEWFGTPPPPPKPSPTPPAPGQPPSPTPNSGEETVAERAARKREARKAKRAKPSFQPK